MKVKGLHFDLTNLFTKKSQSAEKQVFYTNIDESLISSPGLKTINEVTLRTRKRVLITENLNEDYKLFGKTIRKFSFHYLP